jgi:SAM-dependent methyltransferase
LLQEFFASGERHVDHVYRTIRANVQPAFQPDRVLDYGCGVGRLVIPLAKRSHAVVGVDVSPSMLVRARENCKKFGADSACLLHIDMLNSLASASFDLVHSFVVFQHIPTARGEVILRELIDLIADGGVGAIQFTFSDPGSALRRILKASCPRTRLVDGLLNLIQHRPFSSPRMQVNSYSMNRIFKILFDARCSNLHIEFSDHSGFHGAMIYFEKSPRPLL